MSTKDSSIAAELLGDTDLLGLYLELHHAARAQVFVSAAEAAKITGVSKRTVLLWIESGAVRAILVGGKFRVVLSSLRSYLRKCMRER